MDYLSTQPPELLLHILNQTELKDIPALCTSSKAFSDICSDPKLRYRILYSAVTRAARATTATAATGALNQQRTLFNNLVSDERRNAPIKV